MGIFDFVGDTFKAITSPVVDIGKSIINPLGDVLKTGVSAGAKVAENYSQLPSKALDTAGGAVKDVGGSLGNIASSLQMPLIIGGIGFLLLQMNQSRR